MTINIKNYLDMTINIHIINMETCNHDSTSYAFLTNKIDDRVSETTKKININDFLNNIDMQNDVKNNKKFLKCKNGHTLIKYKSDIKKSHFKHKDVHISFESEWHSEWKKNFEKTEKLIPKNKNMEKERYADVVIGKRTFEFQHSEYSKCEINERSNDHKNGGYKISWVLDCTHDTLCIFKCNNVYLIKFLKNDWKYKNFVDLEFIYLDYYDEKSKCNQIFKIVPKNVVSDMIYVVEFKSKDNFIKLLKEKTEKWMDNNIPQCTMYINQLGAGCGKTYESIQLINTRKDLFIEKKQFIYLTKMKSARDVIKKELEEQLCDGKLDCIECDEREISTFGNQYKFSYKNKNKDDCNLIIGTIDAFLWKLGDHQHNESDFFYGIIKSIKNGYSDKLTEIAFAKETVRLNKETIIIIDEAQDLSTDYVQAIGRIMGYTHFDVFIVGDKLQSIWDENNVFTYLEKNDFPYPITIKRLHGINNVRRFHNDKFISFVNEIVPFKKYDLPIIESICDGTNCKYEHNSEIQPVITFEIPQIYNNVTKYEITDKNTQNINNTLNKIIEYMEQEVSNKKYLPKNFMFIFPFLNKNELANKLESKLQCFWVEKFNDSKYVKNVVMLDNFWKTNYKKEEYFQFVYFHKSNEGKAINLNESKNATRILSIHASKGSGCEVVFLLGFNEQILHFYTNLTGSLQYDSLIHVAITRQKVKLYVGLVNDNGDIWRRFNKHTKINIDTNIEPKIYHIRNSINNNKLSQINLCNYFNSLNDLFKITSKKNNFTDVKPDYNKKIVDWGHHVIRNAVFKYTFLTFIFNNEKYYDKHDQFRVIIDSICKLSVEPLLYSEYYKQLENFADWGKNKDNEMPIPLLYFETHKNTKYYKYKEYIVKIVESIQKKIRLQLKNNKIPQLCPLECVIIWHVIDIKRNGKFAETGIMDIYNILYYYDECYSPNNENHDSYDCICKTLFTNPSIDISKNNDIFISIKNHYEKIKQIEKMYATYKKWISESLGDNQFKYNIQHVIKINSSIDKNFKIYNNFWLIVHSENYVINFIFKPQLNALNFNEVYVDMINDNYLIKNCGGEKNVNKYHNKKIINCIMTLDNEPFFYKINQSLKKNDSLYYDIFVNSIVKYFCKYNNELFRFFLYHINHKPKECINGIYNIAKQLNNRSNDKIPTYINTFIQKIIKDMNHSNVNHYKNIFLNEENFNAEIEKIILKYVRKTLPLNTHDIEKIIF